MATDIQTVDQEMLGTIKKHAGVGIAIGVLFVIAGALAIMSPVVAGLSIAIAVGVLLLVGGISRVFLAFRMGSFGHGLLMLVLGLMYAVAGGYIIVSPAMGLATLTLVLAVFFLVSGVFEIIWAIRLRPIKGWGWTLASGIAALVLGVLIWRQFPLSGEWAVGTLVGIQMIFGGSSLASVCGAARSAASEAQPS